MYCICILMSPYIFQCEYHIGQNISIYADNSIISITQLVLIFVGLRLSLNERAPPFFLQSLSYDLNNVNTELSPPFLTYLNIHGTIQLLSQIIKQIAAHLQCPVPKCFPASQGGETPRNIT